MVIRSARLSEDLDQLFALNSILSPDEDRSYFLNEIETLKGLVLVAEEQGRIFGFISLSYPFWNQIGLILHLVVSEDLRSKGIGRSLINAVLDEAKQRKLRFVTVRTASWNERAIRFYERCGFSQKARFEDYFGDGNTMIWLQRDIR